MNEKLHREKLLKERLPIVDECKGCEKAVVEINMCSAYVNPGSKWRLGNCPLATHIVIVDKSTQKIRAGQQKQKKKTKK